MYAIQNVEYERYLTSVDGGKAHGVGEDDAGILELEHQFQNFYLYVAHALPQVAEFVLDAELSE